VDLVASAMRPGIALVDLAKVCALLAAVCAAVACGPEPAPNAPRAVATTISTRCGSCHAPPQAGIRTRAALGPALLRHRKRVRLTEDQWAALLDYLAEASDATTPTQLDR
jgi:hypothetical protein